VKLLKKRWFAIFVMIAVILLSSIFGCRRSLLAERVKVEDYFYNSDGDSYSIQSDIDYISATAGNIKTIAVRYLDSSSELITALSNARSNLVTAETVTEKSIAVNTLYNAAMDVCSELSKKKMNSTDSNFRDSLGDDITTAMTRISHSAYNDLVRTFNALLEEFQANIVAEYTDIPPIELYN